MSLAGPTGRSKRTLLLAADDRGATTAAVIVRREILDDREWIRCPVRVAADDGHTPAVHPAKNTPLTFGTHEFRRGPHPWGAFEHVRQSDGVLQLQAAREGHSARARWEGSRFQGWYVNFQEPMRRTSDGFDTLDQELDP
jgi:hypothetical protein|uniref:DUF402 domain-containing protein n=1 Tax=Streptomyces sp. NBC_01393 TaxID=2903851 RepID=A0AAU3HTV5_9ACTN